MSNSPNTLRAVESTQKSGRPLIFEPALKQFPDAFKLGDFVSASHYERLEWELVRSEVREHLLQLISQSRWKEHLVLRGSTLMKEWFGEAARDPNDIDLVFQPQSVKVTDPLCKECYEELIQLVKNNPRTSNVQILVDNIAMDSIWTYERAEGRRIVFPFLHESGQREIQVDIVWEEELFESPITTSFAKSDGGEISLLTATRELSLAWKLLWLATDSYPQGKDLYDAVLLAENMKLSFELLQQVFDASKEWFVYQPNDKSYQPREVKLSDFKGFYIDKEQFRLEFPWIQEEIQSLENRLILALTPTFSASK